MNIRDMDLLLGLSDMGGRSQRALAEKLGISLGAVNTSLKNLLAEDYIDDTMMLTGKSRDLIRENSPKRAVLLAAGAGIKISPLDPEKPKPMLEVMGKPLVERLITQLKEVGVDEIYVVVGYAKEQFEYLIDEYGVELVVNSDYIKKNNIHSLLLTKSHLENCYVVPCDIWCRANPFRSRELYSWYAVSDRLSSESSVRINRKRELAVVPEDDLGNAMIGISYLTATDAAVVRKRLEYMSSRRRYESAFWEETLYEKDRFFISSRLLPSTEAVEINSIDELWELDSPKVIPLDEIASALGANKEEITEISLLKKGSTNRSFLFTCRGKRYILRILCDVSNRLVDYANECEVYRMLSDSGISEKVVYLNHETGLKISEFMPSDRFCDAYNAQDVARCMAVLRRVHKMNLSVEREFDIFGGIDYFQSLWGETPSFYRDYNKTKENIFKLKEIIERFPKNKCLVHIDAVPDNFLVCSEDRICLIDWEYAAMQDPHLDIAMFALYALYDRDKVDSLIDAYFVEGCSEETRTKIYCYIAAAGLLWSNWCEYRQKNGAQFGEYSIRQYRYAKEYYRLVCERLNGGQNE